MYVKCRMLYAKMMVQPGQKESNLNLVSQSSHTRNSYTNPSVLLCAVYERRWTLVACQQYKINSPYSWKSLTRWHVFVCERECFPCMCARVCVCMRFVTRCWVNETNGSVWIATARCLHRMHFFEGSTYLWRFSESAALYYYCYLYTHTYFKR